MAGTTALLLSLRLVALPLHWIAPRADAQLLATLVRIWARAVARLIGLRCDVEGAPPRAPVLLVSNHLSYVDVLVLLRVWSGVFVAKSEVAGWPGFGPLARLVGTLFVDRRRKRELPGVIDAMARRLRAGGSVLFFPEATSSPGERVLPFRAPLFEAAILSRVAVAPAALHYEVEGAADPAEAVCWWGPMTFPDHLYRLLRLRGVRATLCFGSERFLAEDRELLALAAQRGVESLFRPTRVDAQIAAVDAAAALEPKDRAWHLSHDE
jgi:1-acyl-sn-glycerol-3-phosphate acyltransferase